MAFQAYPTLATYTVLTGLCTRLEATDSSTRAIGGWPLQATSAINPAAFTSGGKYTFSVWVDKGSGFAEVACFAKGLGRYDNDKYRALYLEIAVDNTVPVYPEITAHVGGAGVGSYARAKPTAPTAGWAVELRLTTPSTTSPLTRAVNNTGTPASMWEDMTAGVDGKCPLAWMQDSTKMGRTNAVVLCTDETYLSKGGAFPYQLPRAEEENTGVVGATMAALAVTHNNNFDRHIRDKFWNNVSGDTMASGRACQFSNRVITNATFVDEAGFTRDLTSTLRNSFLQASDQTFNASQPPQNGYWRAIVGGAVFGNTLDVNYYDRAQMFHKKYLATGDLAYFKRFAAHAFAYRHWSRFDDELQDHVLGYTGRYGNAYTYQPQGIAAFYLMTGDPQAFTFVESVANLTPNDAYFGDATSYGVNTPAGEPRPMARIGHMTRWAYLLSRPANASYPEGNVAGTNTVDVRDWNANLVTKIGQALDGSCHATSVAGVTTFANGACVAGTCYEGFPVPGPQGNYWQTISTASAGQSYRANTRGITAPTLYTGATVENVGVSTFMQPIITEWLKCCAHDHPLIGSTLQNRIVTAIAANANYLWDNWWDANPASNPNVPQAVAPSFKSIFAADTNADQYAWYYARQDLTMMYPHEFTWAYWQTGDTALLTKAATITTNGVSSPFYDGSKQSSEAHVYFAEAMAPLAQTPSFGPADHLALSVTARAGLAGQLLAIQPAIVVQDVSNVTVATDTTSVIASLVVTSGAATPTGTLTKVAVSGLATFTDLGLASSSVIGSVCHWRYSRAGLPDLIGPSFTVLTSLAPSAV